MTPRSIISRPVEISLRVIGVWPYSSYRILQRVVWTIAMVTFLTFQYWYFITHFKSASLPELLDGLSLTLSNTLLFLKLIIIWFNTRIFYGILKIMTEDWNDNVSIDRNFQKMTSKSDLSSRISNFMVVIYSSTMILLSASFVLSDESDNDSDTKQRELLIKMEFPFEPTISPIYELIIIMQFIVETFAALMAGMMMTLVAELILHVGSQIDIIRGELEDISRHCDKDGSCLLTLKGIIIRHQRIICLSDDIENVFSYISLTQFLSNTLVICFLGFVMVSSMNTEEGIAILVKCFPYYVCVNFEAFILCFTGEYLSIKSEGIGQAAYDCYWYTLNPRESRIVLILILRSQKRLTITAGKFMDLSLETFASMLKASASYISVLHAMY